MGAELDQVLEALPGPVQDGADLKPLGLTQLVAQLETVAAGGSPEKMW